MSSHGRQAAGVIWALLNKCPKAIHRSIMRRARLPEEALIIIRLHAKAKVTHVGFDVQQYMWHFSAAYVMALNLPSSAGICAGRRPSSLERRPVLRPNGARILWESRWAMARGNNTACGCAWADTVFSCRARRGGRQSRVIDCMSCREAVNGGPCVEPSKKSGARRCRGRIIYSGQKRRSARRHLRATNSWRPMPASSAAKACCSHIIARNTS